MKNLGRVLVSGVAFGFFSQIWLGIISFLATPFIVRHMGPEFYGLYALSGFALGYFIFLEFGLGTAATKYAAEALGSGNYKLLAGTVWTSTLMLACCVLVMITAVSFGATWFVSSFLAVPERLRAPAALAIAIASLGFACNILSGPATGVLRSLGQFAKLNMIAAAGGTLQTACTVLLLWRGFSLIAVLTAIAAIQAFIALVQWALCLFLVPELKHPHWDSAVARRLLRFGGFVTAAGLLSPILANIEKIFLARNASLTHLTFYSVPASLVDHLGIIPSAFSSVLFPSFSYLHAQDVEKNKDLHRRGTAYVLIIYGFFAVFLGLLSKPFLAAWMGPEFAQRSSIILSLLVVGGLMNAAARPALNVILGMGRPEIPLYFYCFETVLYIPAAYVLTKNFEVQGAAMAWVVRVSIDAILLHAAAIVLLGGSMAAHLKTLRIFASVLVVPAMILAALCWSGAPLLSPLPVFAVLVALSLYACGAWRLGLDAQARDEILRFSRLKQ